MRPLVFAAYRFQWLIFGGYNVVGFHLVALGLHIANAVLVGELAAVLSRRQSVGGPAALLFAAYPLSHEVATAVDTLAHPLVTCWCLLALWVHFRGTGVRLQQRLVVSLLVVLAMLTHENGLMLVGLLLVMDLLWRTPGRSRVLA